VADLWGDTYWEAKPEVEEVEPEWMADVKKVAIAEQEERQQISTFQVQHGTKEAPTKSGVGGDQWSAKAWSNLPIEGKAELAGLLRDCEQALKWPRSVLLIIVAMIAKPGGGQRPISLTAALYRLWARIRRPRIAEWEDGFVGFWDTAVRGSSPLRAALLRELFGEICTTLGVPVANLLWDMEKFSTL
jgi:hypothetical protein